MERVFTEREYCEYHRRIFSACTRFAHALARVLERVLAAGPSRRQGRQGGLDVVFFLLKAVPPEDTLSGRGTGEAGGDGFSSSLMATIVVVTSLLNGYSK